MKLRFLGTSHGLPEANRRMSCTMIEAGGNIYFIDMGIMVIDDLRTMGRKISDVKAVFITHMHNDHTDGLIPFTALASWYFTDVSVDIFLPKTDGVDAIRNWHRANDVTLREDGVRFAKYENGPVFDDGIIKVEAFPTPHTGSSHGFIVTCEGKKILFSGDMNSARTDFPDSIHTEHYDVVVCENAHVEPQQCEDGFAGCDFGLLVFNHYTDNKVGRLMALESKLGIPVKIARDYTEVDL
ncbi:MAG: MBL fold metallo-hydrolase [Clostridia bacterium]|nr:MBL fold metallo-hydrolase [Clostridia bacterium]